MVLSPWSTDITESGERHLFAATSGMYPAREQDGGIEAETVKRGGNGVVGSGAYLIGSDGEFRANEKVLEGLRRKEAGAKIWEHTIGVFRDVRG